VSLLIRLFQEVYQLTPSWR